MVKYGGAEVKRVDTGYTHSSSLTHIDSVNSHLPLFIHQTTMPKAIDKH